MAEQQRDREERPDDKLVIVGCDTDVLMWAFPWTMRRDQKKKPTQDVKEMQRRAKLLMRKLPGNAQLVIPAVIVAELLAGVDPQKHARLLTEFGERFFCPPFDLNACPLAARLWQFEHGLRDISPGLPPKERSQRHVLKADMFILAAAKLAGATIFYSEDERCRRLAKEAGMIAKELPVSSGDWIIDSEVRQETEGEDE